MDLGRIDLLECGGLSWILVVRLDGEKSKDTPETPCKAGGDLMDPHGVRQLPHSNARTSRKGTLEGVEALEKLGT